MSDKKKRWYESQAGRSSALRIMAMISTITGCIAVILGAYIVYTGNDAGSQIAIAGAGMASATSFAKELQRKSE